MNWTKEIPTVDGFYKIFLNNSVWVDLIRGGCVYYNENEGWVKLSTKIPYEFYGPLEEPE